MKQIILLFILKCPEFEKTKMIQKKIGGGVLFKSDIEYFIDFTRKKRHIKQISSVIFVGFVFKIFVT